MHIHQVKTWITYLECETARWFRFLPLRWVCPPARSRSRSQPSRQSLVSPHRWQLGPTSGAFRKNKLSQRAREQTRSSSDCWATAKTFTVLVCCCNKMKNKQIYGDTLWKGDKENPKGFLSQLWKQTVRELKRLWTCLLSGSSSLIHLLEQKRAAVPLWWWGGWPCADGSWVQNGWWPWRGVRPLETCTL